MMVLFGGSVFPLSGQSAKPDLKIADSLFNQKKYTESYDIYVGIMEEHQQRSPSMLLKMAFIKEGLGDYSNALFYLNQYYLITSNKQVLKKMEEVAESYDLKGYTYTDADFFLTYYYNYLTQINLVVLALALFLFIVIYYKKKRTGNRPTLAGISYVITLGLFFFLINYGGQYNKGIILESNSYLMSGPSAGSDVIEVVKKGHKVDILGKEDVWVKIRWDDKVAYLKEGKIKAIVEN